MTVSELTALIKRQLEGAFPHVSIHGEISNFKAQSSGHLYFTLKDADASIFCAMFRGHAAKLKSLPKEGDQVQIFGEINVYPPRGNYQLIVKELIPVGVGALLLKFQQLKAKLEAMGWFSKERKKGLPKWPKRIGVVTSPTGAVIRDIIHVLDRRVGNYRLILNPVKVQGAGAEVEIAQAIRDFNKYQLADVLIVGRGGGSFEDLFCFSEEIVAKAIFESEIPIISAVGHETDFSIADFVADVRAPTPTAAAEIVMGEKVVYLKQLAKIDEGLKQSLINRLDRLKEAIRFFAKQPYLSDPYALLGMRIQKLDEYRGAIKQAMHHRQEVLRQKKRELTFNRRQLDSNLTQYILRLKERFKAIKGNIEAINPDRLLLKGYAILFSQKDGSVITSTSEMEIGQEIGLKLADGQAKTVVTELTGDQRNI